MPTKIVAISDMHGQLPDIPPCDILLIAGDICPVDNHDPIFQAAWLDHVYRNWLDAQPATHIAGCAGNHDFCFMTHPGLVPKDLRWHYLECTSVELEGFKIWGSPWQPWFYNWAFNAPEVGGERWLAEKIYVHMPLDTDIVVSHGPPYGGKDINHLLTHGTIAGDYDYTQSWQGRPREHVGSISLAKKLDEVQPLLTVCGHIHTGRTAGKVHVQWLQDPDHSGFVPGIVANASILNEKYRHVYPPMEFTVDDSGIE